MEEGPPLSRSWRSALTVVSLKRRSAKSEQSYFRAKFVTCTGKKKKKKREKKKMRKKIKEKKEEKENKEGKEEEKEEKEEKEEEERR